MYFKRNLGPTISAVFLLGLTVLAATVFYVANAAEQKLGINTPGDVIAEYIK
ncbi:hypothetical protein KGQ31_00225 [Patescibacteria group bacterium]|nr:hypothetical protein [Patescibacteria group bacterium]